MLKKFYWYGRPEICSEIRKITFVLIWLETETGTKNVSKSNESIGKEEISAS